MNWGDNDFFFLCDVSGIEAKMDEDGEKNHQEEHCC